MATFTFGLSAIDPNGRAHSRSITAVGLIAQASPACSRPPSAGPSDSGSIGSPAEPPPNHSGVSIRSASRQHPACSPFAAIAWLRSRTPISPPPYPAGHLLHSRCAVLFEQYLPWVLCQVRLGVRSHAPGWPSPAALPTQNPWQDPSARWFHTSAAP